MFVGLDVGYSATKWVTHRGQGSFPSVVGNVEEVYFSLEGGQASQIAFAVDCTDGTRWLVGEDAIRQSRLLTRREDRAWVNSLEYMILWHAAMSEISTSTRFDLQVVTGLPVTYFGEWRDHLKMLLVGEHSVHREGRRAQRVAITDIIVMPQPVGALLSACLNSQGVITNNALAEGRVGIIDVGGKTTGFLSVDCLQEIRRETHSIDTGCWEPLRLIGEAIDTQWPGLGLRDHEVIAAVQAGQVRYFGQVQDIRGLVARAVEPLAREVVGVATQRWNGGGRLDAILVTGGGAFLVGPYILHEFRQARIVDDPVFANATGFYKYAVRKWGWAAYDKAEQLQAAPIQKER